MPFEALQMQTVPGPLSLAEPASVGVLGYAGIAADELALPFRWLASRSRDGHAAFEVALVAPKPGELGLAGGMAVRPDHVLDARTPGFDLLVVPGGFLYAMAFGSPDSVGALVNAVRRAGQVLVVARLARDARRAHMLLRAASTLSIGTFWDMVGTRHASDRTTVIADGHVTWAIGDDAVSDGLDRIVGEER